MSKRNLLRSTGVIGFATATSRVLGFVRDIVIARYFGTALYAQAFVVAFRIPNLLRDLIGEGAMNAAFVPVFTEELTKNGKDRFFKLTQVIFNVLCFTLVLLSILGIFLAPFIVKLIAPGYAHDAAKLTLTIQLTKALFPFLLLVGLWAYAMGVLNALGHFAAPAFGPAVLNLCMIVSAQLFGENVFGLAAGVLTGGVVQFLIQLPPLYARGWKMRITTEVRHPQAERIGFLLIPRALGSCVYQVNVFIGTILASLSSIVGEGAVAALYYANRVWQLPLAIFGIALAQALLPVMSRHVALKESGHLKDTIHFSLRILFIVLVPATVGLMVLSTPITRVLFQRGAFTAYSTGITAQALFFYSMGLLACGGVKVLVSAFYSLHDTITPVKIALVSLAANIVCNLIFMYPMKIGGLALAASLSSVVNCAGLYIFLEKRLGDLGRGMLIRTFIRSLGISALMGVVLYISLRFMPHTLIGLLSVISAGIAAYLVAGYYSGIEEFRKMCAWIIKKR